MKGDPPERPIEDRLRDSARLDDAARAHFAARRAGDPNPPPIGLPSAAEEAARQFVRACGWRRAIGDGCEVGVMIDGRIIAASDHDEREAVRKIAHELVDRMGIPQRARPLELER